MIALEETQVLSSHPIVEPAPCREPAKRITQTADRVEAVPRACSVEFPIEQRSDHDLMLAVRGGELDALGELFERHHGPLFGFLVKLTGSRPAAEDIVQTVFQRMLKYRHTYRDDGRFTAWMYHLARRCSSDFHRKAGSRPVPSDPAEFQDHADDAPHAAENATIRDDHELLRVALARLKHDDREVLLLSRFQELSFAEISGILECSVGAAKVRAHRALRELRDVYLQLVNSQPRTARME